MLNKEAGHLVGFTQHTRYVDSVNVSYLLQKRTPKLVIIED